MDETLSAGADTWLAVAGAAATYHSMLDGEISVTAVIEKAVEMLDEGAGAYVRKPMITIKTGLVTPKRGDWLEISDERWSVEQMTSDDGYLMQLMVQRKL